MQKLKKARSTFVTCVRLSHISRHMVESPRILVLRPKTTQHVHVFRGLFHRRKWKWAFLESFAQGPFVAVPFAVVCKEIESMLSLVTCLASVMITREFPDIIDEKTKDISSSDIPVAVAQIFPHLENQVLKEKEGRGPVGVIPCVYDPLSEYGETLEDCVSTPNHQLLARSSHEAHYLLIARRLFPGSFGEQNLEPELQVLLVHRHLPGSELTDDFMLSLEVLG